MKKVYLILVFVLFLIGCTTQKDNGKKCLDGWGENSYFPNANKSISEKPLQMKTPDAILNTRLAFTKIECGEVVAYYIKTSDGFEEIPIKEIFDAFVADFNESCNGCLDLYVSGCC